MKRWNKNAAYVNQEYETEVPGKKKMKKSKRQEVNGEYESQASGRKKKKLSKKNEAELIEEYEIREHAGKGFSGQTDAEMEEEYEIQEPMKQRKKSPGKREAEAMDEYEIRQRKKSSKKREAEAMDEYEIQEPARRRKKSPGKREAEAMDEYETQAPARKKRKFFGKKKADFTEEYETQAPVRKKKKWWEKIRDLFVRDYEEEEEEPELEWENTSVEDWDWEALVRDRDLIEIHDRSEREKFIRGCVEQITSASSKLDEVVQEYNMVTAYLKDIEEIEALPDSEKEPILDNAKNIQIIEGARKEYKEKKNRLTDWQFYHMQRFEDVMPKPYEDIKAAEDYRDLICSDLSRLEGEKHAYQYRKSELQHDMANAKGMMAICIMAMTVCFAMLLILQYGFEMEARLGYILTIGAGASIITLLYVKYLDWRGQLEKTQQGMNKIILIKNTVNIRYVNNTGLLDYLYTKYKVQSGKELLSRWERYQQERHERSAEEQNKEELDYHKKKMLSILRRYQLHDPDIWLYQTAALLEPKEMVEIRHSLIERRQKLRVQIDYNKRLVTEATKEIHKIIEEYPKYKQEVIETVGRLQKELEEKNNQ